MPPRPGRFRGSPNVLSKVMLGARIPAVTDMCHGTHKSHPSGSKVKNAPSSVLLYIFFAWCFIRVQQEFCVTDVQKFGDFFHHSFRILSYDKSTASSKASSPFIPHSVLRQVHSLFQSELSTECGIVLPLSISNILCFP